MSKFKFTLNSAGVRELLKSDSMAQIVNEKARNVQARCGEGYETTSYDGKTRVNASVHAKSIKARKDNAKNNTILKALR